MWVRRRQADQRDAELQSVVSELIVSVMARRGKQKGMCRSSYGNRTRSSTPKKEIDDE